MEHNIRVTHNFEVPVDSSELVVPANIENLNIDSSEISTIIGNTTELVKALIPRSELILRSFFVDFAQEIQALHINLNDLDPEDLATFKQLLEVELYKIQNEFLDAELVWEKQEDSLSAEPVVENKLYESLGRIVALMDIVKIAVSVKSKAKRAINNVILSIDKAKKIKEPIDAKDSMQHSKFEKAQLKKLDNTISDRTEKKNKREARYNELVGQLQSVIQSTEDLDVIWASAIGLIEYLETNHSHEGVDINKEDLLALRDFKKKFKIMVNISREKDPDDELVPVPFDSEKKIPLRQLKRGIKRVWMSTLLRALIFLPTIAWLYADRPGCDIGKERIVVAQTKKPVRAFFVPQDKDYIHKTMNIKIRFPEGASENEAMFIIAKYTIDKLRTLESRPKSSFGKDQLEGKVPVMRLSINLNGKIIHPIATIKSYKSKYLSDKPEIELRKMPDGTTKKVYHYERIKEYLLEIVFPEFKMAVGRSLKIAEKIGYDKPL